MVLSMARGRLRLSLRPSPRPRLILTSCTDVVLDTMVMDSDTPSTARGLLMLMLRPILTSCTDMVLDTMVMDSDTPSTARGLLMLRLSLILTTSPSRLYQDLSVNHRLNLGQKWIVISLKFPSPV